MKLRSSNKSRNKTHSSKAAAENRSNLIYTTKDDSSMMGNQKTSGKLATTLDGTFLILYRQLFSKILTFGSNIYITRISVFELLGTLQDYDLLHSTTLILCRESIRMALVRNSSHEIHQQDRQLVTNMAWIPVVLYLFLFPAIWYFGDQSSTFLIFLSASGIELLSEPFYIHCQRKMIYDVRVRVEGVALFVQSMFTLLGCFFYRNENGFVTKDDGIYIYSIAQCLFGATLLLGYLASLPRLQSTLIDFFPKTVKIKGNQRGLIFDTYLSTIVVSFVFQTIVKHLLTVADKLTLVAIGLNITQKGSYKLVSDLGSLVARLLFSPIEETSRIYFAQTLTNMNDDRKTSLRNAKNLLNALSQFYLLLGSYFVFFASNYTGVLLSILFSSAKATPEAISLLSWYCIYVPFMGLNGISEAFLQGVGDSAILKKQMIFMILFWAAYISVSYMTMVLFHLDSIGLIMANILTMTLRICFSLMYIFNFFSSEKHPLTVNEMIPGSWTLLMTFIISYITTLFTMQFGIVVNLGAGLFLFCISICIVYATEKDRMLRAIKVLYK